MVSLPSGTVWGLLTLMWRMQPQQGKGGKAGKADKKAERVPGCVACGFYQSIRLPI